MYQRRPSKKANPQTSQSSMSNTERWTRAILEYVWYCICCTMNGCSCCGQCWRRVRSCRPFNACINATWNALESIFIWMLQFWKILKSILCCLPCRRRKGPLPRWRVSDSDVPLSFRQKAKIQFSSLWSMTFGSICAFLRSLSWKRVFIFINIMIGMTFSAVALIYFIFAIYFSEHGQRECKAESCIDDTSIRDRAAESALPEMTISVSDRKYFYHEENPISKGTFGEVFDCRKEDEPYGKYVLKRIAKGTAGQLSLWDEPQALRDILNRMPTNPQNRHFVEFVDESKDTEFNYIVIKKIIGMSLKDILNGKMPNDHTKREIWKKYGTLYSKEREEFLISYFQQIGGEYGIKLMDERKRPHNDLHPGNVMVGIMNGELHFTIIDLGSAHLLLYHPPKWESSNNNGRHDCSLHPGSLWSNAFSRRKVALFASMIDVPYVMRTGYIMWSGRYNAWTSQEALPWNRYLSRRKEYNFQLFDTRIANENLKMLFKKWYPAADVYISGGRNWERFRWEKFQHQEKFVKDVQELDSNKPSVETIDLNDPTVMGESCLRWTEYYCGRQGYYFRWNYYKAVHCCRGRVISAWNGHYCECFGDHAFGQVFTGAAWKGNCGYCVVPD